MAAAPLFDTAAVTLFFGACTLPTRVSRFLKISRSKLIKDCLNEIFSNLYKPPKVTAPGAALLAVGRLCEIQAYNVSAKSTMRLKGAAMLVKFYDNAGRPLDPDNMLLGAALDNFFPEIQKNYWLPLGFHVLKK
jgi:hypothetical protein